MNYLVERKGKKPSEIKVKGTEILLQYTLFDSKV